MEIHSLFGSLFYRELLKQSCNWSILDIQLLLGYKKLGFIDIPNEEFINQISASRLQIPDDDLYTLVEENCEICGLTTTFDDIRTSKCINEHVWCNQ